MTAALAILGLVAATVVWGMLFLDDGTGTSKRGCGGCHAGGCSGEGGGGESCSRKGEAEA